MDWIYIFLFGIICIGYQLYADHENRKITYMQLKWKKEADYYKHIKYKPDRIEDMISIPKKKTIKPVTVKPVTVKQTIEKPHPTITLSHPWINPCCTIPKKIEKPVTVKPIIVKPATAKPFTHMAAVPVVKLKTEKFIEIRRPRKSSILKPDTEELKQLKQNSAGKLKLTWIELAHLKTLSDKSGIDDWTSLVDTKLSYEENKENIITQYGTADSDNELIQKYNRYEAMNS